MNRAEIKSKRASLELEEARGRRGETGEQWKWNTARGPPRGPDVPPTVTAVQLTSISFDPRAARFCSRLSIVKRGFVIRRKTEIRRLREKSKCLSSVVHFCFDSFAPSSSLEDTYGRKMEERNVEELCEKSTIGHPRRARMQESVHRF